MKILYPLYCAAACCLYVGTAHSYVSTSHSDSFLSYIQTKPLYAKSKPSLRNYPKYALVRFIKDDEYNFLSSKGFVPDLTPTNSDKDCTASAYPYTTDVTAANCASYAQCFDGSTYRMKCTSCKGNMGLANGKCTCANAGYTYNEENPCAPADYNLTIDKPICSEINNKGLTTTYYKACVCSDIYAYTCTGTGQSPVGVGCSVNGTTKYANCLCDSKYSQTCTDNNQQPSGVGCYSTSTNKTLYMSCSATCDITKGQITSWNDWWCGLCINQMMSNQGNSGSSLEGQYGPIKDDNQVVNEEKEKPFDEASVCKVGSIYYSDNTCSTTKISGKTAIGVVVDPRINLVIALNDAPEELPWNDGTSNYQDIPDLYNITTAAVAETDLRGKANTDKIIAFAQSSGQAHKAAQYCAELTTGGKNWFLPSVGQLLALPQNGDFNAILREAGGTGCVGTMIYWTSTEYSKSAAWEPSTMGNAYFNDRDNISKNVARKVRCVFQY